MFHRYHHHYFRPRKGSSESLNHSAPGTQPRRDFDCKDPPGELGGAVEPLSSAETDLGLLLAPPLTSRDSAHILGRLRHKRDVTSQAHSRCSTEFMVHTMQLLFFLISELHLYLQTPGLHLDFPLPIPLPFIPFFWNHSNLPPWGCPP